MSEDIKSTLLALPGEIAEIAKTILELQAQRTACEAQMAIIEVAVKSQVATDRENFTNDTARKAEIQNLLNQNTEYEQHTANRGKIATAIEYGRIDYQLKRDTMNALIAIAGIR